MLAVLAVSLGCAAAPELPNAPAGPLGREYSGGRVLMGTVLELELVARDEAQGRAVAEAVYQEVARLERLVSHYDPESSVSRLADAAGGGPREVDPAVAELVGIALRCGELSRGAFDVTLGPAIEFWRTADPLLPDQAALAAVRARTGHDKLKRWPGERIELLAPGMRLDFGGIAKGWALDRVVRWLRASEIESALLSFGQSSIWALGAPPGTEGWTLALRTPSGGIQGQVTLRDQALSVSSSIEAGEQPDAILLDVDPPAPGRAPIIDPRTLWPVDRRALAVVVAGDASRADALSTAILVLDPDSALEIVEAAPGVEAMIVEQDGRFWHTAGWYAATHYRSWPATGRER